MQYAGKMGQRDVGVERIVDCAAKKPSQKLVAEWIIDVYTNISSEMR
jgi:hypothetical protein